ncbi:MFS transporter [Labedaea rhizosphaerae]|uniref:DHA2 family multidrug resistance protein-like MFS transporter n=1 Tax=Labedaea rhizosphaerae TaxID=598644 RepID=A0A4R6SC65_LABRH|nr:MFS transporter [Labedaea rhizosphaerae]TDP96515.1 DHA2 family multidrug resistance protein-like MFS transporter [Labedaea rhizosphaerae]
MTTLTETAAAVVTRHPKLALALLALPSLLIAIDISVLNVALPAMSADLRPSPVELLWMNDIYGFMVGGTMVTMGTIGDRIGRRKLIIICATIFALASAVAAFSSEPWMIIVTRAVMGIAGAAIMPASMALIGSIYPDPKARVAAMGAYMTCFLTGMAIAPLIGGLLVEHWWWGSVFLLGVPVMVVAVIAAPKFLPESRADEPGKLDLRSAALCLASILLVVYALKSFANNGFTATATGFAVVGIALGVVFVHRQGKLEHPLVDLGLLRRPGVGRTMVVLLLTALVMGGTSLFVSFYLQSVLGLSPLQSALVLVPQMVSMMIAGNLGPRLAHKFAPAKIVGVCTVLMLAGFTMFAVAPANTTGLLVMIAGTIVTTGGIGAAFPFLMNDVISHAPEDRAGSAASLAQTANELGIAIGLVVLGSVGTVVYRASMGTSDGSWVDGLRQAHDTGDSLLLSHVRESFVTGFHTACLAAVAIMVVVATLAIRAARTSRTA